MKNKSRLIVLELMIFILGISIGFVVFMFANKYNSNKQNNLQPVGEISAKTAENAKENYVIPGKAYWGKVIRTEKGKFAINSEFMDPLNSQIKEKEINLVIDSKDQFFILEKGDDDILVSKGVKFDELRVGDKVSVKILDDKKIIYIAQQK